MNNKSVTVTVHPANHLPIGPMKIGDTARMPQMGKRVWCKVTAIESEVGAHKVSVCAGYKPSPRSRLHGGKSVFSKIKMKILDQKQKDVTIEFCYRNFDGTANVRYRRIQGTVECDKLIKEVEECQSKYRLGCRYFYRIAE